MGEGGGGLRVYHKDAQSLNQHGSCALCVGPLFSNSETILRLYSLGILTKAPFSPYSIFPLPFSYLIGKGLQ